MNKFDDLQNLLESLNNQLANTHIDEIIYDLLSIISKRQKVLSTIKKIKWQSLTEEVKEMERVRILNSAINYENKFEDSKAEYYVLFYDFIVLLNDILKEMEIEEHKILSILKFFIDIEAFPKLEVLTSSEIRFIISSIENRQKISKIADLINLYERFFNLII